MKSDVSLLSEAEAIAYRTGCAITEIYRPGNFVQEKKDKSSLTEARLATHAIIAAGLRQ